MTFHAPGGTMLQLEAQASTHLLRFPAIVVPHSAGNLFFIVREGMHMGDKDIHFVDKKVDESWKEQAAREKDTTPLSAGKAPQDEKTSPSAAAKRPPTSVPFLNLLKSLGYQAMIHLGELPHPETGKPEPDLASARETIDLLLALKARTEGAASLEEMQILQGILPELQLKFAEKT